ncbi:hypothetical protein P9D34_13390 [Bacillus swezeyi]|uniref:Uncharacterized protein n=1 Tax=Bacillus swezeyi TaxID=1925020 RepID=A0A1R1RP58_9BACI|nr:hypothetical protein [Bacillus swezeyi]MEC1261426.1 hypothetical protein [Bacillus swezeyi]MED2926711.1 hypothetical protein [Bacillus swezeyi]MED2965727.1 hypothetical protein [Bacillus swezeyi]MED3070870.1 hypothetical protein [Bacillus swezeyi]MED3082530.1 hypothetical protein [Bacillus swezeyi]
MYKEQLNWGEVLGGLSNFISSILNSKFIINLLTSWPLAVIIVVILLRKGILKKLEHIQSLNYKDGNINFHDQIKAIDELQETGDESKYKSEDIYDPLEDIKHYQEFDLIAKESRKAAILSVWAKLERAIDDACRELDINEKTYTQKLIAIMDKGRINKKNFETAMHLSRIRANLEFVKEIDISLYDLKVFNTLCLGLMKKLLRPN